MLTYQVKLSMPKNKSPQVRELAEFRDGKWVHIPSIKLNQMQIVTLVSHLHKNKWQKRDDNNNLEVYASPQHSEDQVFIGSTEVSLSIYLPTPLTWADLIDHVTISSGACHQL